jgi:hypothetical protein
MKSQHWLSTMLGLTVSGLTLAAVMSPLAERALVPRTDQQAQARTAGDIQDIGGAMFSWLTDQVGAAAAGAAQISSSVPVQMTDYPVITHAALASLLVPMYLPAVPELDGWNHPYEFHLNTANVGASKVIALRSPGREGTFSGTSYLLGRFDPDSFDEDIVWADGFAIRWPGIRTDREAQIQTVADIRNIGTAMFSWLTDQVGFRAKALPPIAPIAPIAGPVQMTNYPPISHDALAALLVPQYIGILPGLDGWKHPYDFRLNTANPVATQVAAVRSQGRDGAFSGDTYSVTTFDPNHFDEDIVWADGSLVRSPAPLDGLPFYTITPCRIFDTRPASALPSGNTTLFEIGGACGVPTKARAVAVNVTITAPTGSGSITLVPAGIPGVLSTINFAAGQTRTNNAILSLSGGVIGSIDAQVAVAGNGQVHLILDVSGYFE